MTKRFQLGLPPLTPDILFRMGAILLTINFCGSMLGCPPGPRETAAMKAAARPEIRYDAEFEGSFLKRTRIPSGWLVYCADFAITVDDPRHGWGSLEPESVATVDSRCV